MSGKNRYKPLDSTRPRPSVGGIKPEHEHTHGPGCNHDHDGHDHPDPESGSWLKRTFNRISALSDTCGKNPAFLALTTLLLGTTAMVTPAINITMVAGAVLAGSLWLLKKTSDMTMNHTEALGRKGNLSQMTLGLGLAALTAIPELGVAIQSIFQKSAEVGIGNLVGSNIAHVFLILGATAAITPILKGQGLGWKFNTLAMAGATALFAGQLLTNSLVPGAGIGLLALTGLYLYGNKRTALHDSKLTGKPVTHLIHHHGKDSACGHAHGHDHSADEASRLKNMLYVAGGVAGLAAAAGIVVESALAVSTGFGMSEAAISALIISFGTALPELAVNMEAARRKNTDLAVGNVLGCNIFNILMVGGALSLAGVDIPADLSPSSPLGLFNLAALGTSAGLMTTTLLAQKGAMKRWQGYAALSLYAAYLAGSVALGKTPDVEATAQSATVSAPAPPRAPVQLSQLSQ